MPHSLFISDLHLGADQPQSMAVFRRFASGIAPQAEALYILGDLFEYWAGDDDLHDPFHQQVIAALRGIAERGTKVFLMHGNRDLLMGQALAQACHATLLGDPALIDLYGTPTLLSHGDTLCTSDTEYQRYRAQVHDADFQRQFLARPLAERKAYIEQLRAHSKAEKQHKASAIMDVNIDAVAALLREYRYPRLIHGHTHRPNRHEHIVDGHRCERWVLADWHREGSALHCDANGCRSLDILPE
ncbi:UDP-2,3-diacylglucosamine hydrolase [Ferrigenium kumadai]|uniref:UDP-2,3-diacylglucosamine hydrolase n=1 Tax=Ferrigenium kumadai TaxID=1682490 RepID=A0AAN1T121_9PROT|nr:UDP-2,3-diacylglucosamine diphosphatase [Ferrigenium kumadai]BBJ00212.1 UDP-2,3-diacylglucosamine hydrolase [Ferrigenium kumadai]